MGQVVEYLENQRFFCAIASGKKGSRLKLLSHLGRETLLPENRLVHVSEERIQDREREKILRRLYEIHARRDALQSDISLAELWEVIKDEGEVWAPRPLAELVFGLDAGSDHEAAIIRAVIREHVHFKYREGYIYSQPEHVVKSAISRMQVEAYRLARLEAGSRWIRKIWGVDAPRPEGPEGDFPSEIIAFWIEALKNVAIRGAESEHYLLVRELFKTSGISHPYGAFESLVKAGVWTQDQNLDLFRYGIAQDFPKEVLEQAERLRQHPMDREGREDLTSLHVVTIDGPETLDLDDAISLEKRENGWEIGVHITDIGLLIPNGTPLFNEAMERATTIYLPEAKIPMLPESLSQDAWSLEAGRERAALSFFALISEEGKVVQHRIAKSVILVKRRLTYEDALAMIHEDGHPFQTLHHLMARLRQARIRQGALPLPIPELVVRVDHQGTVSLHLAPIDDARCMVSECMILANHLAARFLRDHGIPALYRSQPEPRDRIITGGDEDIKLNFQQRRLISRGALGQEPDPHVGLGLDCYTTITSPLRRVIDLLMQQQITSYLKCGKAMHTAEDLERYLPPLQDGLARASAVSHLRTRYWVLKHLASLRGSSIDAWILDSGPHKVIAVLSDYLIPVELPRCPGKKIHFGDETRVTIKKVDPRENLLKVDWAETPPALSPAPTP